MQKILQISPQNVFPPTDGGKIGIFNIFKYLNKYTQTDIAFYFDEINKKNYWDNWREIGNLYPINLNTKNTKYRIIKAFLTNQSLYLTKHFNFKVISQLEILIEKNKYDAIICDHTAMAETGLYLANKYNLPIYLRLHNIEYLIWERYAQSLSKYNPLKLFIAQQAKLLKAYEINVLDKFNYLFAINENEKQLIKNLSPKSKVEVINVGVDLDMWNYKSTDFNFKIENTLAIATNYNWVHNVNGIEWFIQEVMPIVKQKYPDVILKLFGKGIPDKLRNLDDNVIAVGFVEDIVSELKKCQIYIAPLFVGAGIRIKILEAMSLGLPTIATKISADGINSNDNTKDNGLFISDDAKEQAHKIIQLLDDRSLLEIESRRAAKFIKENYNWDNSILKMLEIIENQKNKRE